MNKKHYVGGQAVIEGVMMRGSKGVATAVRTPDGSININLDESIPLTKKNKILSLPFIRGFISLIESLIIGIKTLNYSATFFEEEEEEPSKFEKFLDKVFKDKANDVVVGITLVISFIFSFSIFFFLPTAIANVFKYLKFNTFGLNIIEGIIRVSIFLLYLYLISKIEDINRLFQYHGAEHKTIFCYEFDEELTVENARKFKRFHPRCGTNFLFLVMIVSIVLFSFTGWGNVWMRLLYRILLLPLVSGITYEIIRWLGKSENRFSKIVAYPGLKLQSLTTKEPDDSQLEVAIAALKASEGIEEDKTIGKLLEEGNQILKNKDIESYILDTQLLLAKVLERDKLYVITHKEEKVSKKAVEEFLYLINLRAEKMPIKYILRSCEFMGMDFYVRQGVLIPRPDTEILVEEALKLIKQKNMNYVCDLCCGSGAIGLSLANYSLSIKVDCVDISDDAAEVTTTNIEKLKLGERVKLIRSDLLNYAEQNGIYYDMIVCNPPYIKSETINELMEDVKLYEPHLALDGGEDGLYFYKKIIMQSINVLKKGGILAFEIGHDQYEEVEKIFKDNGYEDIVCVKDLAGNDRVAIGRLKEP